MKISKEDGEWLLGIIGDPDYTEEVKRWIETRELKKRF